MPDPAISPDPTLQGVALRYAAGDLPPAAAAAFEARLAADPAARDALAEAVRLSAAALGQEPPAPDRSFRALVRDRLRPGRWRLLARRVYRGHPLTWAAAGAVVVAAATLTGLRLAGPSAGEAAALPPPPEPAVAVPAADLPPADPVAHAEPADPDLRMAEIWAELSTPDHVERAHHEEARRRQRQRDWHLPHAAVTDSREH
jgi:hypothetical protein